MNYRATGSFSPSAIANGTGGYTNFNWTASGPNPSGTCQGYTPVSSVTFSGTVFNKGNDTASNQWSNSSGRSGSDSLETNLILTPSGENVSSNGWGTTDTTAVNFVQSLVDTKSYDPPDPNANKFQRRQLYETGTGPGSDACFNAAKKLLGSPPPLIQFYIAEAVWNVGAASGYSGNTYGYDTVGYDPYRVGWYRTNAPSILPCKTTLQQNMVIEDQVPGQVDDSFAQHTLTVTIGPASVTVTKDNLSQTIGR